MNSPSETTALQEGQPNSNNGATRMEQAYQAILPEEGEEGVPSVAVNGSSFAKPTGILLEQPGRTSEDLCKLATRVGVVLVLVILLALYGQRASQIDAIHAAVSSQQAANGFIDVALVGEPHFPLLRPCQIHKSYTNAENNNADDSTGSTTTRPQVIQTSLSQPSAQWSEVSCFESFDTGSSWELIDSIFGGGGGGNGDDTDEVTNNNKPGRTRRTLKSSSSTTSSSSSTDRTSFGLPSAIIQIDTSNIQNKERTPILGFGGAFTEASALNYNRLNDEGKKAYMELMFGANGLGYSIGRVHINSCDFSVASYSFDTMDGDFNLTQFDMNVTHDVESGMIGMILDAKQTIEKNAEQGDSTAEYDGQLRIYASPWSPPAWMKQPTENDPTGSEHAETMTGSTTPTCLRDGVGSNSPYAKSWALYFSKFISAYKAHGIDFWGVTVQNEPEFPAPWEACAYDKYTQGEFVEYHLGPTLRQDHPDVKLFVFDHNKDHAPDWMTYLLNSKSNASTYIDGTAIHWYAGGMDRLLDGGVGSANMHRLMSDIFQKEKAKKDHVVFGSEACHCPSTAYAGGDLMVGWARAERYAHTVLADLAAGSNAWVEWNLILDERGGPNHLGNLCDAPILSVPHRSKDVPDVIDLEPMEPKEMRRFDPVIGDTRTKAELNAMGNPAEYLDVGLVVQPMYYYMGHISRFVRPGTRPVAALVDSLPSDSTTTGRPFRPVGQTVPGGGLNDLARTGVEVTLWPCEGSTRQYWILNEHGQLEVKGHDWLGKPTTSCLKPTMDKDFYGIVLGDCNVTHAASFEISENEDDDTDSIELVLTNGNSNEDDAPLCLHVKPLLNGGGAYGPRGGAQVKYGPCGGKAGASKWKFSKKTGELISHFFDEGEVCLTTGWPFLQAGAFDNGVVVVLNEANDAANYIVKDGNNVLMTSSIPARSIQTLLL